MKRVSRKVGAGLSVVRRISRRRLSLMLLVFQLLGACGIAWAGIVPEVMRVQGCIAQRQAAWGRLSLERERSEARRALASELKGLQKEIAAFGPMSVDDAQTHSLTRELADVTGLTLTQFVAMEAEDTYLVTFKGAFANVVMLARRLEVSLSALRVRRFIARSSQTSDDYLELELLLQKSLPIAEFATSCATQRR